MNFRTAPWLVLLFLTSQPTLSTELLAPADRATLFKAVGLKQAHNEWIDGCGRQVTPKVELADLNRDGQPEVFLWVPGSCSGGAAGAELTLFVKRSGQWQANLGFPAGGYKTLKTTNKGFPDLEIGGPGFCFPVWRWNGAKYELHRKCEK